MNNRYKNNIPKDGSAVTCQHCDSTKNLQYHHIIRQCDGGTDDPSNIMILCNKCHREEHMLNGDFKQWGQIGGNKTIGMYGPVYMGLLAKRQYNRPGYKGFITKKMLEQAKREYIREQKQLLK